MNTNECFKTNKVNRGASCKMMLCVIPNVERNLEFS